MLGVCGVGMAGLAFLLSKRGWQVSGCDVSCNALATWLGSADMTVFIGHDPAHLENIDRVIVTPAVPMDEPERQAAMLRKIPIFSRGEVLASLVNVSRGVAICGAHGKTTTSCFTTRLLQLLGRSPSWCIGGTTQQLGGVAGVGSGDLLVVEADESDGSLACYRPAVTVLNNIDLDHLEHFNGEEALLDCFRQVVKQTRDALVVCRDNPRAWQVAQSAGVPLLDYGTHETAQLRATAIQVDATQASFEVIFRGLSYGRVVLKISGQHNILNALGAAAAVLALGLDPVPVFAFLPEACTQLPGRRFETIAMKDGVRVIADYAHHPVELSAALAMARLQQSQRLVVVFQPHRYTRTRALGPSFPAAFTAADEVILLPVYAASETLLLGGTSADLYAQFREQGFSVADRGYPLIKLARTREDVCRYLFEPLLPDTLIMLAGAGDVIQLADLIRTRLLLDEAQSQRSCFLFEEALHRISGLTVDLFASVASWSIFGVGGQAHWRLEAHHEQALAEVMRVCHQWQIPWRMVGAGANSWFSDLGYSGCVIRFAAEAFADVEIEKDHVTVGCGYSGPALLDQLTHAGMTGLEFLDSVPGSVGGWLAMNAGAHGGEICERVSWIRCLNPDGEITILHPDKCQFSYRQCAGLQGRIALACGLSLTRADTSEVREKRQVIRKKRLAIGGLRTAGSVFRNPQGHAAGQLLDAVGCKGLRVGGAWVPDVHANVIAVDHSATASDILALAQCMQLRVMQQFGILMKPEISGMNL